MSVDIVNDIEPRVQYTALAAQTDFPYPFPIFADGDLVVDIDGVVQALTTDYTVTGEGEDAGGTVTLVVAATGGEVVTIYRDLPIERITDFQQNGRFSSESFNDELDRITMVQQQLAASIRRALRVPQADITASADMELPSVANRAQKYLYFNAAGDPEMASAVAAGTVFSQSTVGTALYGAQTAAEQTAGVTPTNAYYPQGDIRRYGAVCDGATDDSGEINTALSVGGRVFIPAGLTSYATNLTMGVAGTELVLEAGSTLYNTTATNKLITVSGANCTVSGPGRLLGPSSWLGTNTGEPTMAVLWVTGAGFTLNGVTMENIYKAGLFLNDCSNHRVIGNRFIGNFPYASYGGTNTGHWAILYDPPTSTYDDVLGVVISDNLIETCVQGIGPANFGGTAYEVGVTISGNRFAHCWDHGVYAQNGEGTQVTGNSFVDCHSPIVVQGVSPLIVGNTLYATEPTDSNGQQFISVRDALNAVITGNTIYGYSAGIAVDAVDGTDISGCIVSDNTIVSIGTGALSSAIRLGKDAQTCSNNIIANNVVSGGFFGEFDGAIHLEMAATYYGQNNVVRGNTVALSSKCYGIRFGDQKNGICSSNLVYSTDTAGSAETHILIAVIDSQTCEVEDNRLSWIDGGLNISARGIDIASGCVSIRLKDNTFNLTAPATPTNIVDAGTTTIVDQVTRGATASVTDGATITHGHVKTPTSVRATGSVAGEFVSVTAIGATTFTVAIKKHDNTAGTSQTVYWDVSG